MDILERYSKLGAKFNPNSIKVKKALRVNTLKIKESELVQRLKLKGVKLDKISFTQNGYHYESKFSLGATPEYLQGYYYLQDAASQLPAQVLNPNPGEVVLDMAAAPGGKTTQLAQLMKNKGVLIAIDNNSIRLRSLKNNLERLSVSNTIVYNMNAQDATNLGVLFDKILLDAPCSGNFCVEKDFFKKRRVGDFESRAKLQFSLLETAWKCLKKGGELVYSTCSLEPEEDELLINRFLDKHKDAKLMETNIAAGDKGLTQIFNSSLNKEIEKTRRFWPHKTGTEGFFIAKLKK